MRRAVPPDRLRLLVPDEGERTDIQYLAIVLVLQHASRIGTGDLGHDDLVLRARDAVQSATGEYLSDNVLNLRLSRLSAWGVIEKYLETGRDYGLSQWRRNRQGYRITNDGDLILELLQNAVNRRKHSTSTQEAESLLGHIHEGLRRLCATYEDAQSRSQRSQDETTNWMRECYMNLYRIATRDHAGLLEYLRDLNKLILDFGRHTQLDAQELDIVLERLQAYMDGIHSQFQSRSQTIHSLCTELLEEHLPDIKLGYHLVCQADDDASFMAQTRRVWPKPEDMLERLRAFFDPERPQSLSQEVQRVQGNTRIIISRIRDHWQRILERTRIVQHLERTWRRIAALDHANDEAWQPWLAWNARLLAPASIPTAPNLRDISGEGGMPPTPRRRHTYTGAVHRDVKAQEPEGDPEQQREQEAKEARRLNDLILGRILRDRDVGRLSDFDLQEHDDFRDLLTIIKHSELLLHTQTAKQYFEFTSAYDGEAPRNEWRRDGVTYDAPEIVFRRRPPRAKRRAITNA